MIYEVHGTKISLGHKHCDLFPTAAISSFGRKNYRQKLSESQPAISAITEIELLCWKTTNDNDIEVLKKFISDSIVIELEQPIKSLTS